MPEAFIWKYFSMISSGLAYMHQNRVMHRDVKPANVFITMTGVAKLGDLGFGRFFNPHEYFASTLVGTPYYMAPRAPPPRSRCPAPRWPRP